MAAATAPCKTRPMMSISKVGAMPHNMDVKENRDVDKTKSFTSPNLLASQPVSGIAIAFETPKEVIIQVPCVGVTPKFPEIVGIETFAIVVSKTCINVARVSANVRSTNIGSGSISSLFIDFAL